MSRRIAIMGAVVLGACGGSSSHSDSCSDTVIAGDLVITEVFADSAGGSDEGNEWFEVYNASGRAIALDGLTLAASRADDSMPHATRLDAVTIQPGAYMVFGNTLDELKPAWVDVGYANKLGDLYNTGMGKLALRCGDREIDAAVYTNVKSGESRQLDGGHPPDYTTNDDLAQWCSPAHDAATEFLATNFGTPGAANGDCEVITAGTCTDDTGAIRATVPPAPGDLVLTEIMPNPGAVPDAMGEWFEVKVNRDVDLNELILDRLGDTSAGTVIQSESCLRVTAGTHLVFARSADMGINGGLPRVDGTFSFSMVSGSASTPGDISLLVGTTLIDAFTWTSSRSGKSLQVDPDSANATSNDDDAQWCDGTQAFGEGDLGTPGEPNAECGSGPPVGDCLDGATIRHVVPPQPGDLVITEVMPSPSAVSDTTGEWFEVLATQPVDLNGVGLDRASDASNPNVISSSACLHLAAGERAVFARSSDPVANGGLPAVTAGFTFSLISGNATSPGDVQVLVGTTVIDAVTWTHSTDGASLQVDPDFANAIDNDVETNWCNGATAYGAGDLGTPGAADAQCTGGPAPGTCLDAGVPRAIVAPVAGDLVISEVMPSPNAVSDTTGEWFEVLVTRAVDLNGIGLDRAGDTTTPVIVASADCLRVMPGTRLVFARSADPALNGGLPPITHTFNFSLITGSATTPGDLQLLLGTTTLDSFAWTHSTSGASLQVDPDFETAALNDAEASWCDGAMVYGAGDLGTPAAANAQCAMAVPPGMCDDGGTLRAVVHPTPGQLVITEFLANPAGTMDTVREWFEITNTGATAFDLNDLGLARASGTAQPITSTACKPVAPGAFALFARSSDSAVNGMLPAVDATFSFSLVDTSGDVEVRDGTTILDAIIWTSVTSGASKELKQAQTTVAGNDAAASYCTATTPYGDATNLGSPKAANTSCP